MNSQNGKSHTIYYLPHTIKEDCKGRSTSLGFGWYIVCKRSFCSSGEKRMTCLRDMNKNVQYIHQTNSYYFFFQISILKCLKFPTCSHSRSINASKPLTVLQSGFKMTCAMEVTHNVRSLPSDPCTTTDALS